MVAAAAQPLFLVRRESIMGSKKRSAWQKQKAQFAASLGEGDLFAELGLGDDSGRDPFARESAARAARRSSRGSLAPQGLRAQEPLRQPLRGGAHRCRMRRARRPAAARVPVPLLQRLAPHLQACAVVACSGWLLSARKREAAALGAAASRKGRVWGRLGQGSRAA